MSKKYTVEYFIKKFTAIPARLWTTGSWHDSETGACCAMGHCGIRSSSASTAQSYALREIFNNSKFGGVTQINDFVTKKFPQKTPRGRILAALKFIKSKSC